MSNESGQTTGERVKPLDQLRVIEKKWQLRWNESGLFNSEPRPGVPKFFANYPYSYMNGRAHVGHTFTLSRVEFMSRYMRMLGYNVLFPFAFHYTGSPIVGAAQRMKSGDAAQAQILRDMGVPEAEIPDFADPLKWVSYFPRLWEDEVRALGLSIDWRRKFHTTELNPHYDRFIRWQFRKLRERGYVALGSHPVIWCPSCSGPVGDHDRVGAEDERVTPIEYTLLKFKCGDFYLLAATLRPETIYGQTNLWVDPAVEYAVLKVAMPGGGEETWVVSGECTPKLQAQRHPEARETGRISGRELIGRKCTAPGIDREIIILPSTFTDSNMGTGIVTSVPSDAPDDYIALRDLQENEAECKRFGLDWESIKMIQPIGIIQSKGFGKFPAVDVTKQLGVKNQHDREKLEKAKDIVYKSGFYTGVMTDICGEYAGMPVAQAKEEIKKKLVADGKADSMFEPSLDIKCRCLTKAIVRLVANQWFIKYGDDTWKQRVKIAFDGGIVDDVTLPPMKLYPELVRKQFRHVVDWLGDWACTREYGLGSRLPWDEKWIIESLSDSTIYMAYYTISQHFHHDAKIPAKNLNDEFFDYVFLGSGDRTIIAEKTGIGTDLLEKMRAEFDYWYPFDLRNSGKDLVQNHLAFCVFNHTAIFPPQKWPRGIGVNGWILVDGQKMSKSLGTQISLGDALTTYGADATRLALANAGEGVDDPTFDRDFASGATLRLVQWLDFCKNNYGRGRDFEKAIDAWLKARVSQLVRQSAEAMNETRFRSAMKSCYFDMQAALRWYLERCGADGASRVAQDYFIECQTLMLAPFVPHLCEETWEALGKNGFISIAGYPIGGVTADEAGEVAIAGEEFLKGVMEDTSEILKLFKGTPKMVTYYTSPAWKKKVWENAVAMHISGGNVEPGALIKKLMGDPTMKPHAKDIPKFATKCIDDLRKMSEEHMRNRSATYDETAYLRDAVGFLEEKLGIKVVVHSADDSDMADPSGKAKQAAPGRPGIFIE